MKHVAVVVPNDILRLGLEQALARPEYDITVVASVRSANELLRMQLNSPQILIYLADTALSDVFDDVINLGQRFSIPPMTILCLCPSFYQHERQKALVIGIRGILKSLASLPEILAALSLLPTHEVIDTTIMIPNELLAAGLTKRERQIGLMLAAGHSVKAIATELALAVKTVEVHKTNLMRKLDIHNRSQLTRYFMCFGDLAELGDE